MQISEVIARPVAIPLKLSTRMSTRTLTERHFLLVEVRDSDGASGIGYSYAGTVGGGLLAEAVAEVLAPVVLGGDAEDLPELWQRMYHESLLIGRRGAVLRAISALDIALWDLRAKRWRSAARTTARRQHQAAVARVRLGGLLPPRRGPPPSAVADEIADNETRVRRPQDQGRGLSVAEDAERVAAAIETIGGRGRFALT